MTAANPIRVLVADDHPLLREGIAAVLAGQADIDLVGEASDGREALECFRQLRPDVTLMDLQMPDINGLEASAAIRKLPGYQETPILALTANYSDQTKEQCLAAGMQAFLSKPVDAHELWSAVSRYLKNVPAE